MDGNMAEMYVLIPSALVCILGAYFEWDWFFNDRKVQFIIRVVGRKGAKNYYFLLGFGMYGLGTWLVSDGNFNILAILAGTLIIAVIGMVYLRKPVARRNARRAAAQQALQVDRDRRAAADIDARRQELPDGQEKQIAVEDKLESGPLFPFSPKNLFFIFFRPVRFFTPAMARYHFWAAYVAILLYGMVKTTERLGDLYLLFRREMIGSSLQATVVSIGANWIYYWPIVVAWGIILAFAYWYIGGWWFRLRIKWSGDPDPDWKEARQVYAYSTLVYSLPLLAYTLYQTAAFQGYGHAFASETLFAPVLLIFFPFFSLYVARWAVRTRFQTVPVKTFSWFILLPSAFYVLGICWRLAPEI